MSMASLEKAILAELHQVSGDQSIKLKHIVEWSTSKVTPQGEEVYYYLPELGIHCSVDKNFGKKK